MNDVFTFDQYSSIKLTHDGGPVIEKAVHKQGRPKESWLYLFVNIASEEFSHNAARGPHKPKIDI